MAYLASGHYRQPLAFSDEQLAEAAARVDRIRNYLRDAPGGEPDEFLADRRQAFLDALADDFNTPQAFAVLFEIVAEGNKRELPGARGSLEELLPLLGLDSLLAAEEAAPAEAEDLLAQRAGGEGGQGLRSRRLDPRPARRDGLGGPRRGRRRQARPATLAVADASVIYGRRPVAEAERGRRRVHKVWRAPDTPAEELERLCGSPDHQGVVAEVDPYPYADPDSLFDADDGQGLIVALDQIQDPHNLGAVCRAAEVAGAAGVVIPERRAASVTAAACKASAGAVEHLPVARVRNLADWLAEAKTAEAWIYGADAEPSGATPTSSGPGAPSSCSAPRARASGSGWQRPATSWCRFRSPASVGSLNASVAAAVILFEARRQRGG